MTGSIEQMDAASLHAAGLQGSAVQFARQYAVSHRRTVILSDDGQETLVGPRGAVRKFTPSLKRRYGFNR